MATANRSTGNAGTTSTGRRSSGSTRRSTTTRSTAATRRSTTAKKAATTRARGRAAAARSRAQSRAETVTRPQRNVIGDYAERAVLIPVGAALIARDNVVSTVNDVLSSYSTTAKAQTQLRRFERRGNTARNRLERQVRKTRTRFERELRQRRRRLERTINRRRTTTARDLSKQVEQASAQFENAVQTGIKEGTQLASRVQERVLTRV